ncbi:PREDICTED: nebulin isoform X29 [Aptenodytes forsteri]|uniref:nebulin isoform X29 n=1 Tax=Aptenodytes forsteri TaxID=9233 RepID=UPI000904629D|nr:PREDICTED: nebulin isoform X29 [Aptenodytes forsteri]
MEEEEYEEVVEYYIEETVIEEGEPHEVVTEIIETISTDFTGPKTTTTYTVEREKPSVEDAAPPVRKKTIRTKVDPSKFLTPYLQHSNKMKDLFSENKYKEKFRKEKGKPYASTIDTPEIRRIKKVQDQLSEVKYRMAGEVARTICHVDEKAKDIEHAKKVSQQVSKVLYKQNWEENKDKYLLPPDAPELVNAIKNTAMFSKKLYTEDWEGDKTLFYPYNDSPELRRVAQAQKTLSDIVYKKGHDERKSKYTSLPDPPDVVQAKKVTRQLSDIIYHEDYKNKIKGKWSQTPCYDVAIAKMNAENISMRKYQEDFENMKDQIYFMQTETPEYEANKRVSNNVSKTKYRADYEKNKAIADYNVLPATENPLLRQLKAAGNVLSDKLYKEAYELSKGTSMNYCDTPKFQTDTVLKKFSDVKYKDAYQKNILGHYLGSFEDPHYTHCMEVEAMKSDKNYKADYEEEKTKCYFPQTITQEYEAIKKLEQCKDHTYKKHPDQTKFTQVTDSPVQKQAEINSKQLSDITYKSKGEEIIHKYHLPPDMPQFIQAKVNAYNVSDNCYKVGLEELKSRGYDLKSDAIPIRAAKAARQAASDVNYKQAYELAKGKLIGFKSLQDDPKLVHYMKVAKMQSEREYKKDYEKTKTKYNVPLDMVNVVGAKKAQEIASNTNYKNLLHHYTYLPDAMNVELTKNMMEIQSDNAYKADYNNWMKGIGWIPIGSLEVEKAKKAGDALNEKKYRQHPDTIKFTSVVDSPVMVQAKQNSAQLNEKLYRSSGEEVKHKYTLTPDVPQFIQARYNAANVSDAYYKQGYHDLIAKGNNVSLDAIPITLAKASRNIASDYKYKEAYEKAKGKQVGFRSLQDDPKLVHYMNAAKIQSEREYKKDYEKTKTNYHTPPDMYSIQAAKQSQDVASNAHYKNLIHHYTYLPDAMDVELAKNMMQIQSDNAYKQEYNSWFKGIGWSPLGSLDVEKAKKAGDALNEKKYRQHPDTIKFTSIPDSIPMVLAQHNTKQLSDVTYKQEGEKVKHKYTLDPDVPQFIQARVNAFNLSDANYKADWKKTIAKGYDLKPDAIPIIAAKASRNIASDYKYKESYEKDKGKQVGYRSLQDDPKLVHYMNVAKMQSDREYKKDYEVTKTKYHTPLDMFSVTAAKKAQEAVTNAGYKQPIHSYTLLPDSVSLELSRNVMQLQSDNVYKADFNNWLRGVGWIPIQSLDVEKAKKATEILSEKNYRQHPDKLKYSITMDAMEQVLAKQNAKTMNKRLYTDKWNKEKTSIHVMPDTPEILQSRVNQITMSNKLYKAGWEEDKKKGYDMQPDAIPIKAAKASRDIASDYKYKLAYEKEKGKHIGFRSLEDDPKLVHFMQVAKMQSDREYKKDYEKSKTNFHTPVDMVSVVAAKKAQEAATNTNYKNLIHTYNVLPDAMSLELAKTMMQIQSDNQYRAEYDESMKGVGWMPLGSLEAEKNKKAMEIVSEKKYRQHPDKLNYSVPMDSMNMVLALNNAKMMDEHKYKQAWEEDKKKVHITPDIPQIALAKVNAFNLSDKMYRLSFEESRKKGYDLRADAIPIKAAKASRDIASDYKYKLGYEQDKGKLVGFRSLQDDPKLVHYMQVAKMQSDREYKKAYEMSKTHYQTPSDTLSIVAAKEAQDRVTNTNYKRLIHNYMLLPDAMSLELYRNMNQIQSDNEYKQDYNEWFKGVGWSPAGSLDVEKSRKATEIASDRNYRQHPSMFPFTKQNDAMDMVLAKQNANIMNKHAYTQAWEKDKIQVHVMPDTPDILQAKQNKANYSQKLYKLGWEEMIKKGYDLTPEAISVKAAKASRDIASDYKYKEGYRKQQGHHIGFRSLQDDPKMMWSMQVAKMQSEREYKKDFEKWKTKFNMPVDMLGFLLAKKCQELVSDIDYKQMLHRWTCLPDQNDVTQAKRVYELQSDNVYKSDLQWLRGLGWSPLGSLESEKNKKASEILSEKKYRQHPDTIKFTSIPDAMDIILAKSNAKNRSDILYREAWDKDKTQVHIMPDTPEILLAKSNLINTSDKHYKLGYEELKRKGYDLPPDAIPLKSAKASRDIASEYQYKTAYRKQLGHHIGARNIEDDPKMVWSMHVAKIQSDREYKKAFEKTKTHFSSPVDMLGIVLAKKCQELVSDIDYKHPLHRWTCLPDQNDVVQARKVYDLQSDNVYKSDLLWLRGIGWSPSGSLDDEKNKRAGLILSDKGYRQHPDTIKFTSIPDSMPMVLAKHNSEIMNQRSYTSAWEKDKTSVHIMPDTPGILLAQQNQMNFSEKLYKLAMEEEKKKGYDMRADAIPIKSAKASRDIASDYKYKEGYRKQLGHHIGARNIEDDPKMVWSMHVAKIQSDREYKKAFEKTKTHFSSPVDMLGIVLAKKCQELVSDIDYKHPLHRWTCLPDQNDVVQARKVYDLQSDNVYKSDLLWLRGIGWSPSGSLDDEKNKRAGLILSDKGYRQHPDTIKFTSIPDSMPMVLAKHNSEIMNQRSYTSAWEKDKTSVHIMPDTPGILLAQQNQMNFSEKLYKLAMEEEKKKGYDMRADAIPIKSAKASRDIASDYKYKEGYRKQLGHHIGARNIEDDPKMVWSMHVAKIQSDREYKKAFEKTKTHFSSPVDMLGIVLAKKCQELVSDIDYKHPLHRWTCLPDQNDVVQARKVYDLQSDNVYKSDLEWLRGVGWLTEGSVDVVKAKKAQELLNERLYRTRPEEMKFTSITDTPDVVQAKINALQISDHLYREAWDRDKTQISIPSDTPVMLQSKANALNISNKHYQKAWDEAKAKSYDIRADAIPIKHAKASRDIASEYKYKETHEKQKGHYIGCQTAQEDPKLSWAARAMLLQNDRLYRKAYHDSKAQVHIPVDAMSVQAAKECQTLVSDVDYRHYLHQWTCLPDQNDVIHARKAYDLQSDAVYKSDLEWLRGIGWLPNDSPDVKRVKHAQELLSDNVYRTPIESLKYTSIVDSPDVLLAKVHAEQVSIPKYKEAWEKDKTMIHITPDTPEINLAKTNAVNYSQKLYKEAWDELKMSCDLRADAIPIKAAKASREIASDYKYKLDHEKQKGHYVGVPNAKADSKMQFALGIGKVQSELEYKKHFAKWKTQCHLPVDMLSILSAKHGQSLVSDVDYRHYLHQWICLPDQNDVIQARKAYDLQSDAIYKSDLEWLRGIGWLPNDSVGINHVKYAGDLLSEKKYRTKAETLPFTPVADRVDYITAKNSGEILSDVKYHKAWNEVKSNYTLTDTPQLDMAREAARILNQNLYKESWEKEKATGYLLPPDTVQICHAKHSNDVQSELKYKADYVKQRGHYVGVASMRDDPKLVWFEHAGEIQNDRLYKSDYHKTKSKIHIPPDMVSVVAAKECQTLVSDIDYRQYLHEWICHPDQNDCIQARKAYDLQSDNIYKSDLEWLRGCGWIPLDSVEHKKVKNAQELVNKRAYTKEALDNFSNYTSVVDTPDIVLAKINSVNQSDLKYKETFNLEKGQYIGSDDTPALNHAKDMSLLYSDKLYKNAWEISKPIGYTLDEKYIPLVGAKHANYINSELKYKEIYEKLKGHYLAGKEIGDFPSVIHSLAFQKIRSALAYRKSYEDTKANVHIPSDMMNHVLAKKCQYILSDLEYRTYLHQWNCSPEENDVIQAKKAQEILSDVVYKDDLNWLKGLGCYVWDTPQILHAKKSYDLQSQIKYTAAGKENFQNFGVVTDTPLYVTAVQSGVNASDVKYKLDYHKTKDKYTTVTETVDSERVQNLKHLFSNNIYKKAWEKVKATGYMMPSDAVSLARAKELKHNASTVKYREEYDKFKALYTLPRGVEDDPNTARCLRVGKFNIDRLYKEVYEKNKAKVHIIPDMVDIISAKDAQKKVSEIDYRTHLHEWICLPDLQINAHVRKVTDQLSDVVYKDDLNWLKGIGCFVWDTPEILHAKHAYDLRSDIKYKSKAEKMKNDYTVVMDTPVYVQNVLSGLNLSEAVYRGAYMHNVKGKIIPTDKTVDLERAYHANKIQSENLYRWAGVNALPTGYSLPTDTPSFQHAKHVQYIGSDLKYKEAYEHMKAKGYTLGPKDVGFENVKKVNQVINERLYRATYHKYKDKIHTTPDTPEIRQVRATQEAVSDLIYKSDWFKMQGHLISLPYTPQVLHCRYVGDITSDNKYKQDLKWLKGLGCFLYDTPDMVRARQLRKLWSNYIYTGTAKKMWAKYNVVLDTPGYRTVQELKTHLSELVYRAAGKELKTKYTSILDTPDFLRAKQGQKIQSQYLYVELATKERPHHHAGGQTPAFTHARHVKDMVSEKKYKTQYEKMKDKYTPVPDTPVLIRAKRAYLNASDLRYKETFENTKGKYHTVKDALNIVYHRKVTDDISSVKYKENYMSQLGIWRSIPDRPEHYHHRAVTDAISDVKYKEDLSWLRGTGCYAWDTPSFALAEKNKVLYSGCKYKEIFEKTKSHFKYVADSPINKHFKHATQLVAGKKYKSFAKMLLQHGCNEILRPDMLTALYNTYLWSQVEYKKDYEKKKDKYTMVVDTPEHLRTTKVNKQISDIIYKLEYNKAKPKGYTTIHDTPMLLHVRKVKDRISDLKYKEVYERNKSHCNVIADSVHIKTPRHAYKLNSNLDYKKKYEAAKARWHWIADRPDFVQAAKSSLQQSDYEYKLDREFLKGCKLSVTDDKNTVLALNNAILASDIKYKEKHNKARGTYLVVPDTPQILLAKNVSSLVSENKYKEHSKKQLPRGSYTTLPETRDTAHVKEVTKNVSETNYKKKFVKEKGKSNYSVMLEPPEVKHAMEVAKKQSTIEYKKDAKSKLHYTPIADRPDIKKATQAAKLISDIEYKKRGEAGIGVTMLGRPDIELAKEVSKLTSQAEYLKRHMRGHGAASYDTPWMRTFKKANMLSSHVKYKENFSKEMGKKPKYDLKEAKIYKTMKDAHNMASEVKYKVDLKKLHKPVTDMSESLIMNHVLSTSQLASAYQYKKQYEKSKGHYHVVPDNLEQVHLREASELQSHVKYREKYEKEKGKPMLDFETPTYLTAKESQLMQSEKEYKKDFEESIKGRNLTGLEITPSLLHVKYATKIASEKEYRKDLEEGVKGKGLTALEETPDMLRAKNATQILNEKEYKKALELEIRGKGLTELALETPDFVRAKNATDIASQIKYKQLAEMEKANYTSVVDTPEIIHAQQVKNLSSQKKYKEDAERTMPYYVPVADTPEMQRVRENQKNFSTLQYQWDLQNSKGKVTVVQDTPEMLRVKENQKNFSSILYKEDVGTGTTIEKTPEMQRVKQTQDAISSIKYKENIGKGTPIPDLPEVKRVKETQKHISSVLYKEDLGTGIPTPVTPEIERVKRNQEHISSVLYKEGLGTGIPTPVTPEMERAKRNQENISSVLYKEDLGTGTPTPVTPEIERVKRNQENFSSVLYKESVGTGTPTPITPEMERVKRNQEICSSVLYKENIGKATPTPVTPEMERVKRNQEIISSVLYKENVGKVTPTPITPEMERAKRNQEIISSVVYKEGLGKATPTPVTPEMERVKRNQEHISSVLYKEHLAKGTPTPMTPEMERAKRNQENISSVLYSDSFRKQVQGKAAYVLDTPEMRRVRETQKHISTVKYHEDFEKSKGSFTPVVTDPITERVKKNMQDFSDISYRGIQRRVVEMERKRVDQDQENLTGLRVWRTNPGSVFDYDPAEDNIQSRSLHMISVQAQRRSREHSRSASALSLSGGDEKSEPSDGVDQHLSYYSNAGFFTTTATVGYKHAKTIELPQQRSSSVATQQTTVSSVPSHPSTAGKTYRAMYDYMAADADEVSFKDGDTIVNVQAIDEGWMYGTVQRTGKTGMLPANYVEAV